MRTVTILWAALSLVAAHASGQVTRAAGASSPSQVVEPATLDGTEAELAKDRTNAAARNQEIRLSEQLAIEERARGDFPAALQALERARTLLPDSTRLLYDEGVLEEQMGRLQDAKQLVDRLRQTGLNDADTCYLAAHVEFDQGEYPAAERDLRAYLVKRPADASAHYGLGHLLMIEQRIPEARAELQRSVELQPVQTEAYYQLGQIATDLHEDMEAKPLLEKVLARDPRHGGALTCLGVLAYRAKQYQEARGLLSAAVMSSPDYQPAHYYYGLTLGRLGEKESSARELATAARMATGLHAAPVQQAQRP